MIDLNFYIEKAENVGGFWSFTQNWFDILTLILTLLALWLAYWLGERGYKREKRDANLESDKLQEFEITLLNNNLKQLNKAIEEQITGLENYLENEQFSLDFNSAVQVDFIQFLDIKDVYKKYGFKDEDNLLVINQLFQELYQLNDFRNSLRDSVRTFISRYTDIEPSFYLYRKLMYKKHHEISTFRSEDIIKKEGGFLIKFGDDDFAQQFYRLAQSVHSNPELTDEKGNVIRQNIIDLFIMPLIELCQKNIPGDKDAIEIIDIANEVRSAWINMEVVTQAHFNEIRGHKDQLEKTKSIIEKFLELN